MSNNHQDLFYKETHSFSERQKEASKVILKYPDRIPIIVERSKNSKDIPQIDKKKFLVPQDLTVGQFQLVLRRRMALKPEKAFFIFINGFLPPTAALMRQMYEEHAEPCGFLYCTYSGENTFGN